MVGKSLLRTVVVVLSGMFVGASPIAAQEEKPVEAPTSSPASTGAASPAAPANNSLQREYARLAQLLNSNDTFGKREAASTFLRVRPSDVANPETRKLIARGYRSLALEGRGGSQEEAIQGLVIWGGKYSVPVLIELMEKEGTKLGASEELFTALGKLKDPRGAEAVAKYLGNFFSHDRAVSALRNMGPAAEDTLIKAAPSNDAKVSLAAVQLLGEVGTDKSMSLLQKAATSKNYEIKMAARESMKRIRQRQKAGPSAMTQDQAELDSPFAEGAGPAVDVTARNSRDYRRDRPTTAGFGNGPRGASTPRGEPNIPNTELANAAGEAPGADANEGDWSSVNALLPGDPTGTGVPLDPQVETIDPQWRPQPTRLANQTSVHESATNIAVAGGNSPVAVVTYNDPFNKSIGRMEIVNLKNRRSLGSTNVLGGASWCVLTPKARLVLLVGKGEAHNDKSWLSVMALNGAEATEVATWWPYASSQSWNSNVQWAQWLDEDRFLTLNGEGMLVLWRISGNKPSAVYQIDASSGTQPALSPGRKHLALATPRGVEIFRAADGELLARMGEISVQSGTLAFSQDGRHLACVSGKSVYVWDATTGKLQRDFDCNAAAGWGGSVSWLDDKHLLIGGTDIVDLPKRLVLWRYEGRPTASASYGGWQWMVLRSGNALGIFPAKLLQPEVLAADDGLDASEILALKPGAKVALDIQLGGDQQAKAEQAIQANLKQNGIETDPNSPLRLTARVVTGKSETQEYRSFSAFDRSTEQVTVTEQRYEVELTIDGQTLWKQSSTLQSGRAPMMVHLKDGESAQQAVDRQNAQWTSNFAYGVSLPRYVVHPKYAGPLGTSKLIPGG